MSQRGSIAMGLGGAIAVLSVALAGVGWLYNGALKEKARVQGEYEAFKAGVRELGERAEAKRLAGLELQRRSYDERVTSLEKRMVAARSRADKLCKSAGLSSGCSALPAVPDTAKPVDDTARDQRLLEVLRHAQDTTDKLIEIQLWLQSVSLPSSSSSP